VFAIVIPFDEGAVIFQPSIMNGSETVPEPPVTPFDAVNCELFRISIEACETRLTPATGRREGVLARNAAKRTNTMTKGTREIGWERDLIKGPRRINFVSIELICLPSETDSGGF